MNSIYGNFRFKISPAMLTLVFLISAVMILLDQKPSLAWFQICNQNSQPVRVAFGRQSESYIRAGREGLKIGFAPGYQGWFAEGWWYINPNECQTVYNEYLTNWNRVYYYYAETLDRGLYWGGDTQFCVNMKSNQFSISEDFFTRANCGATSKADYVITDRLFDNPRLHNSYLVGTEWRNFVEVKTGNNKNYTIRLN